MNLLDEVRQIANGYRVVFNVRGDNIGSQFNQLRITVHKSSFLCSKIYFQPLR